MWVLFKRFSSHEISNFPFFFELRMSGGVGPGAKPVCYSSSHHTHTPPCLEGKWKWSHLGGQTLAWVSQPRDLCGSFFCPVHGQMGVSSRGPAMILWKTLSLLDGKDAWATVAWVFQSTCAIAATRYWDSRLQGSFRWALMDVGPWPVPQTNSWCHSSFVHVCLQKQWDTFLFFSTLYKICISKFKSAVELSAN